MRGTPAYFATSRETASVVALARVPRESRLCVGGRSWNVATRSCTEGERPPAGTVPCLRSWTFRYPRPRSFAVLVRSSLGRRYGEEHASAARWPTSQPRQVRAAWRLLRGPSAASPWCDTRAGRAPQDWNAPTKICQILCRQPIRVETSRRSVEIRPIYHYFTKEAECKVGDEAQVL